MKKKIIILVGVLLLLGAAYYFFDRLSSEMMEHKFAHPTTAIVVGKEDPRNHTGDPDSWVVYYRINGFDLSPPNIREKILKAETERYGRGEFRSEEKSKRWYNQTHIGDKLDVDYRWAGDGEIEIMHVANPRLNDQR